MPTYSFIPDNRLISFDYETATLDGLPSTAYYRPDFRAISAAFSWYESGELKSLFLQGEDAISPLLNYIKSIGATLIAHNVPFEMGVTRFRFGLEFNYIDTMRLAQNFDNGGEERFFELPSFNPDALLDRLLGLEEEKPKSTYKTGLSLTAAVSRILPEEFHNHKKEAYDWLQQNAGIKPGQEGRNLHLLPLDVLARYNIADSDNTFRLYTKITEHFDSLGYDWRLDHSLYMSSVNLLVNAEARGILVDRASLAAHREKVAAEVLDIERHFRDKYAAELTALEREYEEKAIAKLKSDKGKEKRRLKYAVEPIRFNIGSNKQLEHLFVGKLHFTPRFFTAKNSPSFRSVFLNQWGDGGEILLKRRKRLLVLSQCDSLLELSERDGRWHPQLKAAGTKTGRYASGAQE